MKKSLALKLLIILAVLCCIAGLLLGSAFASLAMENESINDRWSSIETAYQQRFDLIPALVEADKGISKREPEAFESLAGSRIRYSAAITSDAKASAANQLEKDLARVVAAIESYPESAASDSVQAVLAELSMTDWQIASGLKGYNDAVMEYNASLRRFPSSFAAPMFGFEQRTLLEEF